jgi:hypothetical protein
VLAYSKCSKYIIFLFIIINVDVSFLSCFHPDSTGGASIGLQCLFLNLIDPWNLSFGFPYLKLLRDKSFPSLLESLLGIKAMVLAYLGVAMFSQKLTTQYKGR